MDVKLYANQGLLDMIKSSKNSVKAPKDDKDREKFVEDLVKFSKEAKESRKQQLLSGVFGGDGEKVSETDSLTKYIDKLQNQHKTLKSKMLNVNGDDRKNLQGHVSFIESQLQTLELKRIEIMRAEAGMKV